MRALTLSIALLSACHLYGQSDCASKVSHYIVKTKTLLGGFITYPDNDASRDAYLNSLEKQNPGTLKNVVKLVQEAEKNRTNDNTWLPCYVSEFNNINPSPADANIALWHGYLSQKYLKYEFTSPEFHKGSGLHFDVSHGVADVGKSSEAYSFAARILYSYTFRKDRHQESGGRWRIMAGASTYYHDTDFRWFVNPRVEYRLFDISNKLASIGNVKFIADSNFGDTWIIGGGAGAEIYNFGLHLMYQRQGEGKNSHILTGLFYRIQF